MSFLFDFGGSSNKGLESTFHQKKIQGVFVSFNDL